MAELRRGRRGRVHQPAGTRSWAVALAVVAAMTLMLPAPVAAASLTLDPTSGYRGATVRALATGFPVDCDISILWDDVEIKQARSGAEEFVIEFRVPADATAGAHTVSLAVIASAEADCAQPARDDATFRVVLSATPTPSPTPKPTETPTPTEPAISDVVVGFVAANPLPLAIVAFVLLLGAAGLLVVRRLRIAAAARRAAEPGAWRRRLQH